MTNKNMKGNKVGNIILKILDLVILVGFILLSLFLIINIIKLANIENLLRVFIIVFLILILGFFMFFGRKKPLLSRIILIFLCLVYSFLNYTFYKVYSSLNNITAKVDTKVICLVTSLNEVKDIKDMTDEKIAILNTSMDEELKDFVIDITSDQGLTNQLVEYDGYLEIINALLDGEVVYAFLPENYNDIYNINNSDEDKKELDFNILYKGTKEIVKDDVSDFKNVDEPFTMLLMGTDVILDSYNADTLLLMTVNPKTLKVTMLSIPRDTYTVIACTGGKHKINSSGWYGDSCVVKTVEKYLDIDIDYYAKINFFGVVDLVDKLGGIEVEVPYSLCEQNSKRQFGSNMIYVDEGLQTLNGEQALALTRNRHYWKGMCPEKYTTDGDRSDLTRGANQQLVMKSLLNKLMTVRDINTFYDVLDTISENMTTNMSKDTILSFYNVGKEIITRLRGNSADDIMNIKRLTFKSHSATVFISGLDLSMIVNYNESVEYVSNEMKKNLELIEEKIVKEFAFDINEEYNPDEVKFNRLSSSLKVLPNFVGKTLGEALSYCNSNNLKCESGASNGIITSQSISANTDISTIRNKTIVFELETSIQGDDSELGNIDSSDQVITDKDDDLDDSNNIDDKNPDNSNNSNIDNDENNSNLEDGNVIGGQEGKGEDNSQVVPPVTEEDGATDE